MEEALKQTEKKSLPAAEWKSLLLKQIDRVDWSKIIQDVEKFLERPSELDLLTKENLATAVSG